MMWNEGGVIGPVVTAVILADITVSITVDYAQKAQSSSNIK
jgi:predicted cation transporter